MSETNPHNHEEEYRPSTKHQALVERFFDTYSEVDDTDPALIKAAGDFADTQMDLMENGSFNEEESFGLAEKILAIEQALNDGENATAQDAIAELSREMNRLREDNQLTDEEAVAIKEALLHALDPEKREAFESAELAGEDLADHAIELRVDMLAESEDTDDETADDADDVEVEGDSEHEPIVIELRDGETLREALERMGYDIVDDADGDAETEETDEAADDEETEASIETVDEITARAVEAVRNGDLDAYNDAKNAFVELIKQRVADGELDPAHIHMYVEAFNNQVGDISGLDGAEELTMDAFADVEGAEDSPETGGTYDRFIELAKNAVARGDLAHYNQIKADFVAQVQNMLDDGLLSEEDIPGVLDTFANGVGSLKTLKGATYVLMADVMSGRPERSNRPEGFNEEGKRLVAQFEIVKTAYNETAAKMRRRLGRALSPGLNAQHEENLARYNDMIAQLREHIRQGFEYDGKLETDAGRLEMMNMLNSGVVAEFEANAAEQYQNMSDTKFGKFLNWYSKQGRGKKMLMAAGVVGGGLLLGGVPLAAGFAGAKTFTAIMAGAGSQKSVIKDKGQLMTQLGAAGRSARASGNYENITDLIAGMSEKRINSDVNRTRAAVLGGVAVGAFGGYVAEAGVDYAGDRLGNLGNKIGDWLPGDFDAPPEMAEPSLNPDGNVAFGDGLGPDLGADAAGGALENGADIAADAGANAPGEAAAQAADAINLNPDAAVEQYTDFVDVAQPGDGWVNTIQDLADAEGIQGVDGNEAYQVYMDHEQAIGRLADSYDMGNGDFGIRAPGEVTIPADLRADIVSDLRGFGEAAPVDLAADTAVDLGNAAAENAGTVIENAPTSPFENAADVIFNDTVSSGERVSDVFGDYLESAHPNIDLTQAQVDALWNDIVANYGYSNNAIADIFPGSDGSVFTASGESGITQRGITAIEEYLRNQELVS